MTGRGTGRRTAPLAALVLLLALVAGGCTSGTATVPGSGRTASAADSSAEPTRLADEQRAAVAALVRQRGAALAAGDERAWLASVADLTRPFAAAQAALFDRMRRLPVGDYGAGSVELGPPLTSGQRAAYGADAVVVQVDLRYRLTGYDTGLRSVPTSYVVTRTPEGWRLADVASAGPAQPWDLSPLTVLRSPSTLVVGSAPEARLREYLALADAAHSRIAAVWGSARPAVVVAPADTAGLVAQLQRDDAAGLDQVAAVTDGPLVAGQPAATDRVYVNPTAFDGLTPDGRRVVLTHELTHVTVRGSTTRTVPTWLSEGFADYVGYSTVRLAPSVVAAPYLAQVRAGTAPALPDDGAFDPTRDAIGPVYNAAWLAVRFLAEQHGQDRLVAFYRAVAGGLAVDAATAAQPQAVVRTAFPRVLAQTQDAFVAAWAADVRRSAG
ncbi:hypothetical protein [Lapillicoccus jejuensis]|uniref:Basic secretory peptidase family protein n=1 Tax=Lapillicoccus jejuensis TaxID=402171 RepID=A0A542E5U4_9MICO|nr:hypothetical protein [Lapillicoccus jejuensis]TQJ10646.1 hypothetical protein FB458_3775 [Lapillicoccus jejuensis]